MKHVNLGSRAEQEALKIIPDPMQARPTRDGEAASPSLKEIRDLQNDIQDSPADVSQV